MKFSNVYKVSYTKGTDEVFYQLIDTSTADKAVKMITRFGYKVIGVEYLRTMVIG